MALKLTRMRGESLWVGNTRIKVHQVKAGRVVLTIDAPAGVRVDRDEVRQRRLHNRRSVDRLVERLIDGTGWTDEEARACIADLRQRTGELPTVHALDRMLEDGGSVQGATRTWILATRG